MILDLPKEKSPGITYWNERYGTTQATFELEAVSVKDLQEMAREAILSLLDMKAFAQEQKRYEQDRVEINQIRQAMASDLDKRVQNHMSQ